MSDSVIRDLRKRSSRLLSRIQEALDAVDEGILTQPEKGWPLWKQFYHLLYWLDFWFIDPLSFNPPAFHEDHFMKADASSPTALSKQQLLHYYGTIKDHIDHYLTDITAGELERESEVRGQIRSRFDVMLGQFTHVSHHIGYICATVRMETGGSIWKTMQK